MSDSDSSLTSGSSIPASSAAENAAKPPAWQPLTSRQRRVLGTLIEKAKTTPDAYPMTIAGLTTGCNQKSNRDPQMNLTQDQVEEVVDQLRPTGAVTRVEGTGRVTKVRHYAYPWFGITGPESAVMTELLLRGPQTLGELRQRASRMDPIADLGSLQLILSGLQKKNLIVYLTPAGRGQIVTHNVYQPHELEALRAEYANHQPSSEGDDVADSETPIRSTNQPASAIMPATHRSSGSGSQVDAGIGASTLAALEAQIEALTNKVQSLQDRVEEIEKLINS